eukprot:2387244-Pyramimonas_sp.AAC.1
MRAPPLGPRLSSLWGHEALYCAGQAHANAATETFGGAPVGATKRRAGWGRRMRAPPLRPLV